ILVGIAVSCWNVPAQKVAHAEFLPLLQTGSNTLVRGPYLQMGTPSGIRVKWRTEQATESLVMYGTELDHLHLIAGDFDEVTEHEVALGGLSPQTKYYYAIETVGERLAGGAGYFFVTAPIQAKPTRIWVIGDSGTEGFFFPVGNAPGVRDAYEAFAGERYTDLWLMLGDN